MNTTNGSDAEGPGAVTAAQLFEVLWRELVAILGTAAAATLVRRAAKRACLRRPDLCGLQVVRDGWDYRYELPPGWEQSPAAQVPALAELVSSELVPLLREFTGQIVVGRLGRIPGARELGLQVSE